MQYTFNSVVSFMQCAMTVSIMKLAENEKGSLFHEDNFDISGSFRDFQVERKKRVDFWELWFHGIARSVSPFGEANRIATSRAKIVLRGTGSRGVGETGTAEANTRTAATECSFRGGFLSLPPRCEKPELATLQRASSACIQTSCGSGSTWHRGRPTRETQKRSVLQKGEETKKETKRWGHFCDCSAEGKRLRKAGPIFLIIMHLGKVRKNSSFWNIRYIVKNKIAIFSEARRENTVFLKFF